MRLGIDFGTCFSSAALMKDGELIPIPATDGHYSWPSSAYLLPTGEMNILVGRAAENLRARDITRYQHEFKRLLGAREPLRLGDRSLFAHVLVDRMLHKLKEEAEHLVPEPLTAAVVTVPATYTSYKRGLMEQAARAAGFQTVELLEEPVAAAMAYAQQSEIQEGEIVMVYDLGGGTFDIALLRKLGSDYEFLAPPAGLARCGGTDFDQAIYADLCQRCSPQLQAVLDPQRQDAEALLARSVVLDKCIELKHQLSEAQMGEVALPALGVGGIEYYQLSRQAFEQMIAPEIEKTLECSRDVLKSAGLQVQQVNRILLVGGSCRIPYIRERQEQAFGRRPSRARDLQLVVCQGAALVAGQESVAARAELIVSPARGEGRYTTIREALRQAQPGVPIRVRPGVYRESLVLERTVELVGMGQQQPSSLKQATCPAWRSGRSGRWCEG